MKEAIILMIVSLIVLSSCTKSLSKKEIKNYTDQGNEIAHATQKILGSHLSQNMQKGGVEAAIPFCNSIVFGIKFLCNCQFHFPQ